ncbi:MAG: 2-oxo acid dehydrogenase subunit E2 [Candidatus Saganbacteria bacterium]|nr:2-oxo acid dehydrogenase subunit E2 [Candidatus Saganbacteria bacterium]
MKLLQEVYVPQVNANDRSAQIISLNFASGDQVKKGDLLLALEYSKTVFSVEAETDGYIKYFCRPEDEVAVNGLLLKIYDQVCEPEVSSGSLPKTEVGATIFSKAALELIKAKGIDKARFANKGFVSRDDVLGILGGEKGVEKKANSSSVDSNLVETKKISHSKKLEIDYLSQVQSANMNSAVSIYLDVEHLFKSINQTLTLKNSLLPLIIFEVSRLLLKYPEFNAYFAGEAIAYYKRVNVGIALDLGDGLKVVKIKDTADKSIGEIEAQLLEAGEKYIDKKLSVDDLTGSTFTITDLSAEDITSFVPLINQNQSAILGVAAVDPRLQRVLLTLAFDHRVTAGKKASSFIRELKERIKSYTLKNLPEDADDKFSEIKSEKKQAKCYLCLKSLKEDQSLKGPGLIKVITHDGREEFICRSCLEGWR